MGTVPAEEIKTKLREFVARNFLLGQKQGMTLKDGDSFLESGLVDSTGVLEFVDFLQENWDLRVADDELTPENFDSLDNLAAYVQRKLAGGA